MSAIKWSVPAAEGSDIAGTTLNSLATGSTSSTVTYDNTPTGTAGAYPATLGDIYIFVRVNLGSITPTTGGSISLNIYLALSTNVEDIGGTPDTVLTKKLTTTASAKVIIFRAQVPPCGLRLSITNNSNVTLNAASNNIRVTTFGEASG